jgi:ribosome-associated protein
MLRIFAYCNRVSARTQKRRMLSQSTTISNEERARRYLDQHGLGEHKRPIDSPHNKSVTSTARDWQSSRRLPRVLGVAPTPAEIVSLLRNDGGGLNVVDIDVSSKASFTNSLILCTGRSPAHISALAERLVFNLRGKGVTVDGDVVGVAGDTSDDWAIVDAGVVVTHILSDETRSKYNLESLWTSDVHSEIDASQDEQELDAGSAHIDVLRESWSAPHREDTSESGI